MNNVAFICPLASFVATEGKILSLAAFLTRDGFPTTVICWDEEIERGCKALALPYVRLSLVKKEIDRVKAAEGFFRLLGDRGIVPGGNAPTWGELLAFDDFYGLVTAVDIRGVESIAPSVAVLPLPGGESSTEEDEHMRVVLARWVAANKIPVLGIEVERLDHCYEIIRFPVDMALLKRPYPREYAPLSFPLPPLYRHFCGHGRDPHIEQVALQEVDLRKALGWVPGRYYLVMLFHLYYIQETIQLLQELSPLWKEIGEAGVELVLCCGNTHRRGLTEKEMLIQGLAPWLAGIPHHIVENGNLLSLSLLSEGVLFSHRSSIEDVLQGWGVRTYHRGELAGLKDLVLSVRPQEALCYLLQPAEERNVA